MLKIEVPENDQSVYELKTESGETHLIRCPGTHLDDEKEGLFCFVLEGSGSSGAQLRQRRHSLMSLPHDEGRPADPP